MNSPKFSVVLIARNESKTLPRMLASLGEFRNQGGEIILVDTGSTDDTPKLARAFGCKVFCEGTRFVQVIDAETADAINGKFVKADEAVIVKADDRLFDFSAARNYAVSKAAHEWVLVADCDEAFTALDIAAINSKLDGGGLAAVLPKISYYEYDYVFAHDDKGQPLIQFRRCHLYHRGCWHWNPKSIVHEVLVSFNSEAPAEYLLPSILKLEHWQNAETNRDKYLTGLAMDCFLNPANDRNSHYFARELFYRARWHSAISEFHRHIAMKGWAIERAQSMIYIGDCYAKMKNVESAITWWMAAFINDGTRREPLMRLATFFGSIDDHHKSAAFASAALALPRTHYYMDNENYYNADPHALLYVALWWLGDKTGSKYHWQKAIDFQPANPKFLHDAKFYV